jgi:hypothetical protein
MPLFAVVLAFLVAPTDFVGIRPLDSPMNRSAP